MFSHTKFQIGVSICQIILLQYVWIKPHSSSLTNEENLTSNFCQSFQICCGEKGREENNGNCKAFYVTRKCKNFKNVNELILMIDTFLTSFFWMIWKKLILVFQVKMSELTLLKKDILNRRVAMKFWGQGRFLQISESSESQSLM